VKRFPSARRVKIAPEFIAYMKKIDAYRAGREPIALMRVAPAKLARAIAGLSAKKMRRRPARGKWSIVEILGHLQDTEFVYGYRMRLSLAEPGATILGYNQAVWTEELRHKRGNAKQLIERIRVLRDANLEMVQRVPRASWKRYGMHNERGKETVRRTLELVAGHDLNHLDQIRAIRKKYRW
jgi:uncharacterized damage-inducible protein DinB